MEACGTDWFEYDNDDDVTEDDGNEGHCEGVMAAVMVYGQP